MDQAQQEGRGVHCGEKVSQENKGRQEVQGRAPREVAARTNRGWHKIHMNKGRRGISGTGFAKPGTKRRTPPSRIMLGGAPPELEIAILQPRIDTDSRGKSFNELLPDPGRYQSSPRSPRPLCFQGPYLLPATRSNSSRRPDQKPATDDKQALDDLAAGLLRKAADAAGTSFAKMGRPRK
jgi:hypothetical protein